jgi:zinc resistance-associated protein
MKKLSLLLAAMVLGLFFLTPAFAGRGGWGPGAAAGGYGYGPGYCDGPYFRGDLDDQAEQARQKFLEQSKELRQQLYDKKTTYYDLMDQEKPDKEAAAKLWGEIFDLQSQLQKMAAEAGFRPGRWRNDGYGDDGYNGPCGGYGPRGRGGYGRGCYGPGGRW